MLAQKLGRIPSNEDLASFLEKDIKIIEEAILCGEALMMSSTFARRVSSIPTSDGLTLSSLLAPPSFLVTEPDGVQAESIRTNVAAITAEALNILFIKLCI
jgi:hypothetical protein